MKRFTSFLSVVVATLGLLLSVLVVPAQAATSSGLSIQPRKDYFLPAGQTAKDTLTIGNLNPTSDLVVSLKIIDFTFLDDTGTPKLSLAVNAPNTTWSLKPFMTVPSSIVVPAGQSRTVPITVTIPKNQGAGSYYSAIQYAATGANGSNVSLSASGVSLVFVSVPGIVHEDMTLQRFGAYQSDAAQVGGSFVSVAINKPPEQLAFSLKNNGNVAESPQGTITLKHMFSHKSTILSNVNPTSSLALLGQNRLFTTCIQTSGQKLTIGGAAATANNCVNAHLLPGRYTANLDVFYGQNGNPTKEVTATAHFWYLPWWFLILVTVILLAIIVGVSWLVRKIRRAVNGKQQPAKFRKKKK